MIHTEMLHNAGIIPTTDVFRDGLAETALSQGLPVTAALKEDTLTLKTESSALVLTLLHSTDQLGADAGLAAIGESLCGELDALAAAHPQVKWLPVGRFTAKQLDGYMKSPHVCAVCDLSFLDAPPGEWDTKCRQLRSAALGYSFAHMGIHNEDASDCRNLVNTLQEAFGFPVFDIGSSVMVSKAFEVTKANLWGTCGHIGIETASVARAISDLQAKGFGLDESTIQRQPDGRLQSVYLDIRLGGFPIHLVQKR